MPAHRQLKEGALSDRRFLSAKQFRSHLDSTLLAADQHHRRQHQVLSSAYPTLRTHRTIIGSPVLLVSTCSTLRAAASLLGRSIYTPCVESPGAEVVAPLRSCASTRPGFSNESTRGETARCAVGGEEGPRDVLEMGWWPGPRA